MHMKLKLRFFFMNPIEKWEAKKQIPYKFLVQVVKIFFVTIQVNISSFYHFYDFSMLLATV